MNDDNLEYYFSPANPKNVINIFHFNHFENEE